MRLREFTTRILANEAPPAEVLDAGSGAGANMLHLADLLPDARWTGLDLDAELVELGREHLDPERFTMVTGNLLHLERQLGAKRFDLCLSIMTLSWIEDYERAVEQMLAVTKRWLVLSSLFGDTDLDAFIRMRGRLPGAHHGYSEYYNIYSLPRFREFCRELGAKEVIAEPFEIDIDLPRPEHGGMGTWTERTEDGRRLQFSGPLSMPSWFVAVRV
jgi:ubiquinone/menaquinone biosynthesis C-methylase UbiE